MKVIFPASQIPDRSTVTKRNGRKRYILRDSIRVNGEPDQRQEIKGDGMKFLVSSEADITAIADTIELVVEVERDEFLHEILERAE